MIVEQFLRWLTTASAEERAGAARPLVRACLHAGLEGPDRDTLEAIMMVYLDDGEACVRKALAEALAADPAAPHPVVLTLAQDEPAIAAAVVAASPVLLDAELVDLVAGGSLPVQIAAAAREGVSPGLAAAIAEVGEPAALVTLLGNHGAAIPVFSLKRIVERAGDDTDVLEALLERPGVPIGIRQSLLERLAVACHDLVLMRSTLREDRVEAILREAKDKATLALAAGARDEELRPLAEHLRETGQLTTLLLIRAACTGNIRFLREALAILSGVPPHRVSALLSDRREGGFRALYRKAGMPGRVYPAFRAAIEVNRDLAGGDGPVDTHAFARRVIDRILQQTGTADPEVADLIVILRRFSAEAARDGARRLVAETLQQPAALPGPEGDGLEDLAEAALAEEMGVDPEGLDAAADLAVPPFPANRGEADGGRPAADEARAATFEPEATEPAACAGDDLGSVDEIGPDEAEGVAPADGGNRRAA
ncbi:DUF2336 domain-containing protein [Prosthecomicrobium sp. N25]|uniref:DUF2336 domain-containing protein n=1 Tax=Prosthecomicrobium sp. N25 TaxID=3129254 RepID=UPI0030778A63